MYDKALAREILRQIDHALVTISQRFEPVGSVEDFTGSPAGEEKRMSQRKTDVKSNQSKGQDVVVPCARCVTNTHHEVLQSVDASGTEEVDKGNWFSWESSYQIVRCRGCEEISFRETYMNSEDYSGPDDSGIVEHLYPDRRKERKELQDTDLLPHALERIYQETHRALNSGLRVLAGVGLRAIVETVCKDIGATGRNLEHKIDDLVSKKMLSQDGAETLQQLRVLGNAAAHEVKPHSQQQLELAMDVAEHLLEGAYILPEKARSALP